VWRCVVRRLLRRCLILYLVAVFVWFISKDQFQSITDSINDLYVSIADPEAWVFWWFWFYHIACRHFFVICY